MNTALVLAMGHSHRKAIRAAGRQAAAENDLLYPPTQYGLALQLARLPLVVCLLCIFTLNLPRVSAVTQFLQVLVQAISNGAFSQLLLYYIGGTKQLLTLTAASTFDVWGPPGPCCCCRVPYACGCCAAESLRPSHLKVPPPPPPSASAPPATARHRPECCGAKASAFLLSRTLCPVARAAEGGLARVAVSGAGAVASGDEAHPAQLDPGRRTGTRKGEPHTTEREREGRLLRSSRAQTNACRPRASSCPPTGCTCRWRWWRSTSPVIESSPSTSCCRYAPSAERASHRRFLPPDNASRGRP
jgi:hypothetical protein